MFGFLGLQLYKETPGSSCEFVSMCEHVHTCVQVHTQQPGVGYEVSQEHTSLTFRTKAPTRALLSVKPGDARQTLLPTPPQGSGPPPV